MRGVHVGADTDANPTPFLPRAAVSYWHFHASRVTQADKQACKQASKTHSRRQALSTLSRRRCLSPGGDSDPDKSGMQAIAVQKYNHQYHYLRTHFTSASSAPLCQLAVIRYRTFPNAAATKILLDAIIRASNVLTLFVCQPHADLIGDPFTKPLLCPPTGQNRATGH